MRVKIIETNERLGVKAGEVYKARRYHYDPHEKIELLERVTDGYDPCCTQYFGDVHHFIGGRWHKIEDGRYVPVEV